MKKCKWCEKEFENRFKLGGHQTWCEHNPNLEKQKKKLSTANKGKQLSEEHKEKISKSRIEYLKANPDKVPYKLNHKHKETYPEKYFKKVLKGFIKQYRVDGTLYEIDFANPKTKLGIEIDGEQHYVDKRIVQHDIKRTNVLENKGWKIIRIRWSEFTLLAKEDKEKVITDLLKYSIDPTQKLISNKQYRKLLLEKENERKKIEKENHIKERKEFIINSGIDLQKRGSLVILSEKLNITPQSLGRWIKKYM